MWPSSSHRKRQRERERRTAGYSPTSILDKDTAIGGIGNKTPTLFSTYSQYSDAQKATLINYSFKGIIIMMQLKVIDYTTITTTQCSCCQIRMWEI